MPCFWMPLACFLLDFGLEIDVLYRFGPLLLGKSPRNGILAKDYMWLDEDLRLKATYVQFHVGLNYMTLRHLSKATIPLR